MWKGACVFWWICGFMIFGPDGRDEKWWIPLIYGGLATALTIMQLIDEHKVKAKKREKIAATPEKS